MSTETISTTASRSSITSSRPSIFAPPGSDAPCLDVDDGIEAFPGGLDLCIDGDLTVGQVSTVVSLIGDQIEILRAGLGADALE